MLTAAQYGRLSRRRRPASGTAEPAALPSDLAEPGYRREWTRPPVAEAGRERDEYAALMDNMIACSERQVVTRVAVAPAVTQVGVASQVRAGIAAEAQRRGLTTGLARLEVLHGRSVLEHRTDALARTPRQRLASASGGLLKRLVLGLASEAGHHELDRWLQQAEQHSDLVVVDGLPLDVSFDTALVARACDGLLIVAQPNKTTKASLRSAAERARRAGCHVLGVVIVSPQRRAWRRP